MTASNGINLLNPDGTAGASARKRRGTARTIDGTARNLVFPLHSNSRARSAGPDRRLCAMVKCARFTSRFIRLPLFSRRNIWPYN